MIWSLATCAAATLAGTLALAPCHAQTTTAAEDRGSAGPVELAVIDRPNDAGDGLMVTWRRMGYEGPDVSYELLASDRQEGPFYRQAIYVCGDCPKMSSFPERFGFARKNEDYRAIELTRFVQPDPKKPNAQKAATLNSRQRYFIKLAVLRGGRRVGESAVIAARPAVNWIAWQRTNIFIGMVLICVAVLYFVRKARSDPESIFVRRIAGLEAVDEALGRAAEMGKPIFFCHGLGDVALVVTISALNLLGKIAERVAEYGTEMKVTCYDYVVMQVSQEMVKEACVRVGRPDSYRDESIFFISDNSFAYATAVEGMLLRERPAACFYFGQFMSESLLLSETGSTTGAIQIAGTDVWAQIPFFITTCDYTLIGEELYAASAYLSREPRLLGTIKGQDVLKAGIMGLIVLGTIVASIAAFFPFSDVGVFARLFLKLLSPLS